MLRSAICLVLLMSYMYSTVAVDYTLFTGTASATTPGTIKLKTTTTGATAPKLGTIQFEYAFSADATVTTAADEESTIC